MGDHAREGRSLLLRYRRQSIESIVLEKGGITLTYEGGHNKALSSDTIVYEYKTGPYLGQQLTKPSSD